MATLVVGRIEATERIQERIAKGQELLGARIRDKYSLDDVRGRFKTWDEYNTELIAKLFTTDDEAVSYTGSVKMGSTYAMNIQDHSEDLRDGIRSKIRRLESLVERMELFDEPSPKTNARESQEQVARNLLKVLESIQQDGFQDASLIQEAKNLNARLAPTYMAMYGAVPVITTSYPPHVWWRQAYDQAGQALATASAGDAIAPLKPQASTSSDRVFIVHGHDHGLKEAVARFVDRLGYTPVILHERADRGQTIIEKFEREAPDVAFAVVCLTPDDVGGEQPEGAALKPRARQNVVWEFGYFTALLGRGHVAALVVAANELERPSDLDGVLYIAVESIDEQDWRMKLAHEMRGAGLDIDLNKVD